MKETIKKISNFMSENEIFNFGINHKVTIFMFICALSGIIMGSVLAGCINLEVLEKLNHIFLNDFKERMIQNSGQTFVSALVGYFIFALILELSALAAWGSVAVPLLVIFRGIGCGVAGGYLYLIYGLKGIAFYILILIPGMFVSIITYCLFGVEMFKFSVKLAKKVFFNEQKSCIMLNFKKHIKKFGYCLVMLCFSAFLDMCFTAMFSGFFDF